MKEIVLAISDATVESSLGWRVEMISVDFLEYSEDGRTIKLEIEDRPDAGGELEWIIYTPENWVWNNDEPLMKEKISDILNRIDLAFWKLDRKIKEII
jgi:hypothetical protein